MPRLKLVPDTDELALLGRNIRYERKIRGWSIQRLARLANVAPDTVFRIEKGRKSTERTRHNLCTALQSSYKRLTMESREQNQGFAIHHVEDDAWHVHYVEKGGGWKPEIEAIQSPEERLRLGRLRFVRDFVNMFNCRLPGGKLVSGEFELFSSGFKGAYLGGEAFVYVLRGRVRVEIGETIVVLSERESLSLDCSIPFCFSPEGVDPNGLPPRLLYVRLSTVETRMQDEAIKRSMEEWEAQGQGSPTT